MNASLQSAKTSPASSSRGARISVSTASMLSGLGWGQPGCATQRTASCAPHNSGGPSCMPLSGIMGSMIRDGVSGPWSTVLTPGALRGTYA